MYHTLALRYHPDKNNDHDDGTHFKKITHAYSILSNPTSRELYDMYGSSLAPNKIQLSKTIEEIVPMICITFSSAILSCVYVLNGISGTCLFTSEMLVVLGIRFYSRHSSSDYLAIVCAALVVGNGMGGGSLWAIKLVWQLTMK